MTRIIHNAEVGHWIARQFNGVYPEGAAQAIGFERDGKMVAGMFFENFNGRSMIAHMAINGRATAEFYRKCAEYAFKQCGVFKLIAPIPSENVKSIRLVEKMGFLEECRIFNASPDGDIVLFTLIEQNCRFLKPRYAERMVVA